VFFFNAALRKRHACQRGRTHQDAAIALGLGGQDVRARQGGEAEDQRGPGGAGEHRLFLTVARFFFFLSFARLPITRRLQE
jgi:hypothetical protein